MTPLMEAAIFAEQEASAGTQPSAPGDAFGPNSAYWLPAGIVIRVGHDGDVELSGVQPFRCPNGQIRISVVPTPAMLAALKARIRFFSPEYTVEAEEFRPLHFNDDKRHVYTRALIVGAAMVSSPRFRGTRIRLVPPR